MEAPKVQFKRIRWSEGLKCSKGEGYLCLSLHEDFGRQIGVKSSSFTKSGFNHQEEGGIVSKEVDFPCSNITRIASAERHLKTNRLQGLASICDQELIKGKL